MKTIAVNIIVSYWNSPLFVRRLLAPFLEFFVVGSSNKRVKEYIQGISTVCAERNVVVTKKIKKDILKSFILFGASPLEYFLFNYPNKSLKERDEFLTDAHRTQLQKKYIGMSLFKNELINKYNFYERNKKFFGRECFLLTKDTKFDSFKDFVKSQGGNVFIKENKGSFGFNASRIKYQDSNDLLLKYNNLQNKGSEWIVEGVVEQSDLISVWNQSSVNTIRIPSYLKVDGSNIIFGPFIRTGRYGAVVDNAGAGGIFAVIDEKTGKIITDGADENFNTYDKHPDSNVTYKGWQVPKWNELVSIVSEAHKMMPNHKYIAYDFALTNNGWLMIEGNWGQYVCQQTATQQGCKNKFMQLIKS